MWEKLQVLWRKTNRWHRVLLVFLMVELRVVPGGQLGFRCNDPALSHPFTGDTVSWKWLIGVSLLLPLAVMLFVERFHDKPEGGKERALFWYKEYLFGTLLNLTLVQTLKLAVGSPRPHFFDTCQPKEALTCVGSEYVSSYTCTKAYWLSQSDKSFPSGHTSLALHAGVFVAYYLSRRSARPGRGTRAAQWASVAGAAACALSRLSDRRHRWWDVAAGAVLGVGILLYTICYGCKYFECLCPSGEETTSVESHQELQSQCRRNQNGIINST